jgi:hypothetical protein
MALATPSQLIISNNNLIERTNEFVSDKRFINNEENQYASSELEHWAYRICNAINQTIFYLDKNRFDFGKEKAVKQIEQLKELYFDKFYPLVDNNGAIKSEEIYNRSSKAWPDEYEYEHLKASQFTEEYLDKFLCKYGVTYDNKVTGRNNKGSKNGWPFKVGLHFASGEIQRLLEGKLSYDQIADKLGFSKSAKSYITFTRSNKNSRSIYSMYKVMLLLEEHYEEEIKKGMCHQDFIDALKEIKNQNV